jgi:hypothetical protein
MFMPFSYTVEELGAFRQAIYTDCLTARADALFELEDALLTTPYVTSPVALSLSPSFRRKWSSVFDALSDGGVDQAALRGVLLRVAPADPAPLWAIDHTLWARPDAVTLPDRGFYHQPTRVPGGKPVAIGHAYTTVGIVPEVEGSWCLPLDQRRISPDQTPVETGAAQLKELLREVDFRPLVTGDSEYACAPFLKERQGAPWDLLLRVRPNRVLYGEPGPYSGRGRPRVHGARFALGDETTWSPPDQEWEGEDPSGKRLHVRAWEKMHFKGAAEVKGTLILGEWPDAKGTRRDPKRLWLFWVGQTQPPLSQMPLLYGRRFSIEHFYRFEKTTLRWNRAQVGALDASQRWTEVVTLVYWELWLARGLVQGARLPWDRKPRKIPTPGQVRHQLGGLLARIGTPASVPKPRGKSPGRRKGERPKPRPRHPVVKKSKTPGNLRTQSSPKKAA